MLRALRYQEKLGKLDLLLSLLRRCVRPLAAACVMFLLMRAEIITGFAPFAAAFFAAALAAGESPAALVLGCLLGMLRLPLRDISMVSAVGCAGVLAGEILFSVLPRLREILPETRASLVAGFGVLLPALAFAAGDALQSMQALGCAALASACAPFFLPALGLRFDRKCLMTQERIGAAVLTAACLCGMHALFEPLARGFSILLVLLLPGLGASGGVLWGLALFRGGLDLVACLGVAGFVSGLKIYGKNWQRSLAVLAVWGLLTLFEANIGIAEAVLASAVYVLLPEAVTACAALLQDQGKTAADPDRATRDAARESARRLRALGDAFSEMADGCAVTGDVPDEQALICAMRERLCAGCGEYGACWNGDDNSAVRFLCHLIEDSLSRLDAPAGMRVLYSDGDVPPDVLRFCRRGRMIPDRLGLLLRDFAEKRRSEIKRCATGRLLSVQLAQAREILYDLAEKQSATLPARKLDALRAALDAAVFGDIQLSAFENNGPEIHLRKSGGWTQTEAGRARDAIRRCWGCAFSVEMSGVTLVFRVKSRFKAETGAASQSGIAGQPCGDSHIIQSLSANRLALMLSDGMGSGEAAAAESAETLRLLHRFLDAGISRPLALETVNQQMLMRTGDDIFATVDLCIVDLNTGIAEFSKLAACRSLIIRDQEILRVEGGRLPLGILERVQSDVRRVRLRPGDVIVMGSDGVMELGDGMMIDRLARVSAHLPAQALAEKLVREAAIRRSRGRMDDMTCVCLRVEEVRQKKPSAKYAEG